jgi:cellulose synthase (UDP-forming)
MFNGWSIMSDFDQQTLMPARAMARLSAAQRLLVIVYLIVAVSYLAWRPLSFNTDAIVFSWLVYGAELFGFLCAGLYIFMCWQLKQREVLPVPPGATADVFVPTLNESTDILRRTLMAAMNMQHVGEVWLLDDGDRAEMRTLADELGCRYLARKDNSDAKAGNINHALHFCDAQYIALFDADHAPAPNFLQQTLGFFADEQVAFVQTPHDFYNLDSFQNRVDKEHARVWSEQLLFFRVIQPGKDRLNSAFFCGSCAVVRREAIEDIGGMATGTVTEDIHTSMKLHKRGWKSVYLSQSLAYGLAPSTVTAFLKQRLRWGQGAMQTWRREGLLFSRGLSLPQKLSYLATMLAYFEGWQRLVLFFSPVIVLISGIMPIAAVDEAFLVRFIPYFLLNYWVFEELGRGYGRSVLTEQYTMTRFAVFIAATFGYFLRKLAFVVTPKNLGERDATRRILWPQFIVLGLNAAAIPIGIWLFQDSHHLPQGALVANLIWAGMTVWLAVLAIAHAVRVGNYRRREYRFPVPAAFEVAEEANTDLLLVTDVSPNGCRLIGPGVRNRRVGDHIRGALVLPGGKVSVQAMVRSLVPDSKGVGCEFVWRDLADQATLELFLYGSDLQWRFNGLTETLPPPIERFMNSFRGTRRGRTLVPQHWVPLLYRRDAGSATSGVAYLSPAENDKDGRHLIALEDFPEGSHFEGQEVTAVGTRNVGGHLVADNEWNAKFSPMHVYRWST